MGVGYQVFDEAGNLEMDASTDTAGRVLGYVNVTSNGSLLVPALANVPSFFTTTQLAAGFPVKVSINSSNGLITWTWGTLVPSRTIISYGLL